MEDGKKKSLFSDEEVEVNARPLFSDEEVEISSPKPNEPSLQGVQNGSVTSITPSASKSEEDSVLESWIKEANPLSENKPITASQTKGAERTFPISPCHQEKQEPPRCILVLTAMCAHVFICRKVSFHRFFQELNTFMRREFNTIARCLIPRCRLRR